jgi:hypothetical protein
LYCKTNLASIYENVFLNLGFYFLTFFRGKKPPEWVTSMHLFGYSPTEPRKGKGEEGIFGDQRIVLGILRASDRNGSTIIASFNYLPSLKTRMSGARSSTGLICSHGSHMDEKIPRPKMPKTALPPELRRKLGFQPRAQDENTDIYKAGSGVLKPKGSGNDGSYLKMKSSIPMSQRTSGLAKMQNQYQGQRALIPKSVLVDSNKIVSD